MPLGFRPLASAPLAGRIVSAAAAYTLTALSGSVTYQGAAANLLFNRKIVAAAGSETYQGSAATLTLARRVTASAGSETYQGLAANLLFNRKVIATAGNETYQGIAATLTKTAAGAYVLTASRGSISYSGAPAQLLYSGAAGVYGGVWLYGLKHWKRLRGEEDEEEIPLPVVEEIATVVARIPTPASGDDIEGRLLLRLELERKRQFWRAAYVEALAAYREGYAEAQEEARQAKAARDVESLRESVERTRKRRRRMALMLLLAS